MLDVESTFICPLTTLVMMMTDGLIEAQQQLSEINRNARNNWFQLLKEGNGIARHLDALIPSMALCRNSAQETVEK
jgi:hypothetical protein